MTTTTQVLPSVTGGYCPYIPGYHALLYHRRGNFCDVKFSHFIILCKNIFVVWSYPWNFLAVNQHYDSFVPRFSDQEWDYIHQENMQSTELLKELTTFTATMQLLVKHVWKRIEKPIWVVTVKTDDNWTLGKLPHICCKCNQIYGNFMPYVTPWCTQQSLHLMTYIFFVHQVCNKWAVNWPNSI